LDISIKTVAFHRTVIKRQLGARGTAGIVRWAMRFGVIEA
jgi:DNA-binding CsgD family transcriptional regulator